MKVRSAKAMIIVLVGCAIVFGAIFGFIAFRNAMMAQYFATLTMPPTPVSVAEVKEIAWTRTISAIGTLQARNGVDISPQVAGTVQKILFESGQTVKKGDELVHLDADQEKADLRSQQAEQSYAVVTASRYRTLSADQVVSQSTRDRAEADLNVNNAKIASIEAAIRKKVIEAPFDGVLGVRKIDVGQYLQAGTPIVNLQDLSVMYDDFSLSQKDLPYITIGQALKLTVDAYPGKVFEGRIEAIEPRVDATSGMVLVRGYFENPEGLLRPGMFSQIEVVLPNAENLVVIPQTAISYSLTGDTVFVIREPKKGEGDEKVHPTAERVNVTVKRRSDDLVAVDGLKAGDRVVTAGQLKLRNNAPVDILPQDLQTKPATVPLN